MPESEMPKPGVWSWLRLVAVIVLAVLIITYATQGVPGQEKPEVITGTALYAAINDGRVKEIDIYENGDVEGVFTDGKRFKTSVVGVAELEKAAVAKGVPYEVIRQSMLKQILWAIVPWILLMFLAYYFFFRAARRAAGGVNGGGIFDFARSRVQFDFKLPNVRFDDVAGCDEAKEEVMQVLDFNVNPEKYKRLGVRVPRGLLLVGPPGCGKTMLAKALATEARASFGAIRGSDFVEMFVGVGAARIRDLFKEARIRADKEGLCIVFIDEIDGIGGKRSSGAIGGHEEREQTLNALLAEMDGFDSSSGILVIAATNRSDILDPALVRPGRFDKQILIDEPDVKGREEILKVHICKIKSLAPDVDLAIIAKETPGFCGADLEELVNEAGLLVAAENRDAVTQADLWEAIDKARGGGKKRKRVFSDHELQICTYHELGHALTAYYDKGKDAVRKITIIPRGSSGGATHFYNVYDEHIETEGNLKAILAVAVGGRAMEILQFSEPTSGACSDLGHATAIAKRMVCELGMSNKVGLAVFERRGLLSTEYMDCSESKKREIDEEVQRLLKEALDQSMSKLKEHGGLIDYLAAKLREKETLTGAELHQLIEQFNSTR